ncbi:MAG: nucleotidyl transferase AbiEii/AbiGii toxin family protein [Thermomicrobiales bacterium]
MAATRSDQRLWHGALRRHGDRSATWASPVCGFWLFTDQPLDEEAIRNAIPALFNSVTVQDVEETLSVIARVDESGREVNLSFFGGFRLGRVGEPRLTLDEAIYIASLDDLMALKLAVILQRIEAKDYVDIDAMIQFGVSLDRGLAAARLMYEPAFQPMESLKALSYFEGGNLWRLTEDTKNRLTVAAEAVKLLPEVSRRSRRLAP